MNPGRLSKFISYLVKNYQTYVTQEKDGQVVIDELREAKKAALDGRLSFYSWKRFFVPECETLFNYENERLSEAKRDKKEIALLGLNLLDLKYVLLYDRVFAKDPYYQARRDNLLIVAHNFLPGHENNLARVEYKEENLNQYSFDIFLACEDYRLPTTDYRFNVFAGSGRGEEVLKKSGYNDYRRIECLGSLNEDYPGSKMNVFREKLKNHHNPQIWEELGKRCIECGKCTIVCPTCFCFRIDDSPSLEAGRGQRQRCWDACFYQEFSEVAGPSTSSGQVDKPKFLKNTAEKIHFWYYHKFGRIPDEYSIAGCVGCHRCYQVCPVEIDIKQTLEDIEQS
jgi:ferredoxin